MCDPRKHAAALVLTALMLVAGGWPAVAEPKPPPGLVDGTQLIDLVGDEAVRLEVSIGKSLIATLSRADPDLQRLAGGLDSIYAVILDLADAKVGERARRAIREIDRRLVSAGWERVARVREDGAEIKVLALNDGETIQGLVVMIVELDDDEPALIFANVAGRIDLAALQQLGEGLNLPGLRDIELDTD